MKGRAKRPYKSPSALKRDADRLKRKIAELNSKCVGTEDFLPINNDNKDVTIPTIAPWVTIQGEECAVENVTAFENCATNSTDLLCLNSMDQPGEISTPGQSTNGSVKSNSTGTNYTHEMDKTTHNTITKNHRKTKEKSKRPLRSSSIKFGKVVMSKVAGKQTLIGRCNNIIIQFQREREQYKYKGICERHDQDQFLSLNNLICRLSPISVKSEDIHDMRICAIEFINDNNL